MRGGRRPGAGRKQGFAAKNAEETRRILAEMVMREIRPIGRALVAKAKKGDVIATRELLDRAFGKPPQGVKVENPPELLPIPIFGFRPSEITEDTLEKYAFTDEEREVLTRRLLPKRVLPNVTVNNDPTSE